MNFSARLAYVILEFGALAKLVELLLAADGAAALFNNKQSNKKNGKLNNPVGKKKIRMSAEKKNKNRGGPESRSEPGNLFHISDLI